MGNTANVSPLPQAAIPLKEETVSNTGNSNNVKVEELKEGNETKGKELTKSVTKVRKGKKEKIDYLKVELDYLNGGLSYRDLAKKYGVSYQRIGQVGKERNWDQKKKELQTKVSEKINQNLDKVASQVAENISNQQIQIITNIKTKHIQEAKQLISIGMKHLKKAYKEGTLKDTTALEAVKHGHDTIHTLEGMKKEQPTQQTIVFLPQERTERMERLMHEVHQLANGNSGTNAEGSKVVEGEVVG